MDAEFEMIDMSQDLLEGAFVFAPSAFVREKYPVYTPGTEVPDGMLQYVADWVYATDEGKRWLGALAADVGVPLQLALPLDPPERG